MIEASCHCGAVVLEVDSPPAEVNDCHCSICRRYGTLWAYYAPESVRMLPSKPLTDAYLWGDGTLEFHRCQNCGCVSHWAAVDRKRNRMAVNARLMPPEILAGARVRHRDGADTNRYTD